ncbi:MAG: hypothetical protein HYY24_27895 [Verrucomicrobia bacterium]|nr:hypothetical protein [Verrucomicrobiota bacterium]
MLTQNTTRSPLHWPLLLLTALSLSIGWGIRGNFGHEFGAMIPGALAAMAAALLSGREDWWRRVACFAFFGALGWSFGGSISYMQVIAYTHSGHSLSVFYGYACLFVIGFLWAAMGGAGTALPALLDRERLTEFFAPLSAVFVAWLVQDVAENLLVTVNPDFRHESPLYWYDTDWLAALTTIVAILILALVRRRFDRASSLILHMAFGWWVGFAVLVLVLGWRLTPPRGDSWAGCVGMVGGLWIYCWRHRLTGLLFASLVTGLIGGFGFASADLIKHVLITSGWNTNWHSVLEQTYGFINGLGVAVAMGLLAARAPRVTDDPPVRRWTESYAVAFVLVLLTYLNLSKNPGTWVKAKSVPEVMYGLSADAWFGLAYAALAAAVVGLLVLHARRPLALVPGSWLGKGQLLYVVFLWWMVVGNFERSVVGFVPQRMITEGVIFFNAVVCTLLLLFWGGTLRVEAPALVPNYARWLTKAVWIGALGFLLSVAVDWEITRAIHGDRFDGYGARHIRFGPESTATKEKPKAGQKHP